ncbi:retrovirus-related pol polyprotein from transposon TNT 1-94 [Tanacetum coccineum]
MLSHVLLEERSIIVMGLRGGLLGANPIPHRSYIPYRDRRLSISEEALGAFGKSQTYRTDTGAGAEGTTEGGKHNRNKSKSWKIREIKYMQNITCWNCNQKGHFHNQCLKLVASRDKEVNMAAGDSDDALVCCVENTVEDRIMDSGASFHATYCKEELERFKLRSGKVRLADDKTLDIAAIGDVVLKTSFGTNQHGMLLKVSFVGELVGTNVEACIWLRIGMSMLASKGNVPNVQKVDIYFCKPGGLGIMSVKTRKLQSKSCGRVESTGIRVEAPKMLWADSVSTAYLIYRIPYVPIGLRIPEEEWRGKDTSLTHLKVFGCDSFVKVKDVCGEAMKCTFIGSGSDEVRYSFQDTKSHQVIRSRDITFVDSIYGARSATNSSSLTKPIQKSQVVLVDIPENLAENDSIVAEHGLSLEITQSPGGSSDTSEGSENSGSFEDSGRSDEEYSEDGASSKEGGSETPHVRRSTRESRALERRHHKVFKVKEEENGRKRYKARFIVKGFQQKWKLDYNEIFSSVVKMTTIRYHFNPERSPSPSVWLVSRVPYVGWYRNVEPCSVCSAVHKVRAVALLKGRWFEVYKDYLRRRAVK